MKGIPCTNCGEENTNEYKVFCNTCQIVMSQDELKSQLIEITEVMREFIEAMETMTGAMQEKEQ